MGTNLESKLESRKKGGGLRSLINRIKSIAALPGRFAECLIAIRRLRSEFNIDADSTKKIFPAQTCKCVETHGRERDKSFSEQGDFVTGRGFLSINLRFFTFTIQKNFSDFRIGKHRNFFPIVSHTGKRGKDGSGSP